MKEILKTLANKPVGTAVLIFSIGNAISKVIKNADGLTIKIDRDKN